MAKAKGFNAAAYTAEQLQLGRELLTELGKGSWAVNEARAISLVKAGAALELTDADGNTPLLLASQEGLTKTGVALVEANANVNATNKRGDTALHITLTPPSWSSDQGAEDFLPIADAILKKKPDVNIANQYNQTPIVIATQAGLYSYAQEIIALKPNLNIKESINHRTLLQIAQSAPYGEPMVKLIREARADAETGKKIPVKRPVPIVSW